MFDKSRYGIVRGVAVHLPWAQVSRGSAEGIALLTLFCKTGGCAAANAVRNRCVEMCATRTAMRVNCARGNGDIPHFGRIGRWRGNGERNEECPHFLPTASPFQSRIAISASNCERFDV